MLATLTYTPDKCTCCGMPNKDFSIVKNGFLTSRIKWVSMAHYPTYIRLKQRFLCRNCQTTFVAQSNEIQPRHCFIANRVKQAVALELGDEVSLKNLSSGTLFHRQPSIACSLNSGARLKWISPIYLPIFLLMNLNRVKSVQGKMSFIYMDSVSHAIQDILSDRRLTTLRVTSDAFL